MIDLEDVQSTILVPSKSKTVDIKFITCASTEEMREFLLAAASAITDAASAAERRRTKGEGRHTAMNVGVTGHGLLLAGVGQRVYDALPTTFTGGMRAAASRLGDLGVSAPVQWETPFDTSAPVHAVILRYGEADWGALAPHESKPGWCGRRGDGDQKGKEPFGFEDGISNPVIEGSGEPMCDGDGVWDPVLQAWRPVHTGEAVIGYVDESGAVAGHPDAAHVERNGSYFVLRKLEQDVGAFNDECKKIAAALGIPEAEVGAQMVGRYKDGRVLGDPEGREPRNDFLYRTGGPPVPPSAHIRRANPRDDQEFAAKIVPRHLLFRRGYPYVDEDAKGKRTGLLFMACCADLRRQFEFVQSHWLQDGNRFGLGTEQDPLVGQEISDQHRTVSFDVGGQRRRCNGIPTFVKTRGGEYFLLPSRSALYLLGDPG